MKLTALIVSSLFALAAAIPAAAAHEVEYATTLSGIRDRKSTRLNSSH